MGAPAVNLAELRLNRGLSISDAAEAMGVKAQTLARAERGEFQPHPSNALKIATFYDLRVTDIWPLEPDSEEAAA